MSRVLLVIFVVLAVGGAAIAVTTTPGVVLQGVAGLMSLVGGFGLIGIMIYKIYKGEDL